MSTKNILLTGVGGQGTILASKLLTVGLIDAGYDVKMSEVHGMSQREGPVLTHVRFGKKVFSPIVEKRKADVIMGFEELEVLRNLDYLRDDGQGSSFSIACASTRWAFRPVRTSIRPTARS